MGSDSIERGQAARDVDDLVVVDVRWLKLYDPVPYSLALLQNKSSLLIPLRLALRLLINHLLCQLYQQNDQVLHLPVYDVDCLHLVLAIRLVRLVLLEVFDVLTCCLAGHHRLKVTEAEAR